MGRFYGKFRWGAPVRVIVSIVPVPNNDDDDDDSEEEKRSRRRLATRRMHSLFSRSRTTSSAKKQHLIAAAAPPLPQTPDRPTYHIDDFGRLNNGAEASEFMPLFIPTTASNNDQRAPYGHLAHHTAVILPPEHIERMVDVLAAELSSRGGLTTPFVFSSQALDISRSGVARLITKYLDSLTRRDKESEKRWREEARFAGMHECGMALRWALTRAVRRVGRQRGLVQFALYAQWRDREAQLGYPPTHFASFLEPLNPTVQTTLLSTFALLTSLTANSASSGHTPPTLSPLFGPLIFGLPPSSFHETYSSYLRATNAMEHLLISFIRWRDVVGTQGGGGGSAATLGVPTRLKDWIRGYPANLSVAGKEARRGARTVRVLSVRRNVRMYTQDLVSSAATWGAKRPGMQPPSTGLITSKEWARIVPPSLNLPPRYSDSYMKRMDMPPSTIPSFHAVPSTSSLSSSSSYTAPASLLNNKESTFVTSTTYAPLSENRTHGAPKIMLNEDRFRSLTDLKWGAFESLGFGGIGGSDNAAGSGGAKEKQGEQALQFDLTEGARQARAQKRSTLTWTDFSSAGFTRSDEPLTATLQFNPLTPTVSQSSINADAIAKKLRKTAKGLPEFGWDTEPVVGTEVVVEEAFVDVFCDVVWGGRWSEVVLPEAQGEDGEEVWRERELERECNWALIEFRSMPTHRSNSSPHSDPRTGTSLLLFEEFVPLEYRQALATNLYKGTKRRLPLLFNGSSSPLGQHTTASGSSASVSKGSSMFSSSKKNKKDKSGWRVADTLNGRPYNIGDVPVPTTGKSERADEFEGMLRSGNGETKVLSLMHGGSITAGMISAPIGVPPPATPTTPRPPPQQINTNTSQDSRFRLPGSTASPNPGSATKSKRERPVPAEYSSVDFETQLAVMSDDSDSDASVHGNGSSLQSSEHDEERRRQRQKRRESGDDAWVDILVGTQAKRLAGQEYQEAEREKAQARRSNPALASLAVAEALRGIPDRSPSPPSPPPEIDTVPRAIDLYALEDEVKISTEHPSPLASDDEEDEPPQVVPRRLGYFDLHPDRKPAESDDSHSQTRESHSFDDPRKRLDEESDSEGGEIFTPVDVTNGRVLPPPPTPPKTLPASPPVKTPAQVQPSNIPVSVPALSKTASLIEMYREKEQKGSPPPAREPVAIPKKVIPVPVLAAPTPLQPSRIPVAQPVVRPLPVPVPVGLPSSPAALKVEPEVLVEPPKIVEEPSGRDSPARYVHGAPLHNVMEEEEDE